MIQLRDQVHSFITLTPAEVRLMDTFPIQRLRGISQLAMANLVYPGATHTRFDHSVGVMHVAGLMADALGLTEDRQLIRYAALLHDVGHGPFSHVSEKSLERYADRSSLGENQKREKIHEIISARIIRETPEIIHNLGEKTCEQIVQLLGPQGHGQPALKSIVSGPLDADKQDYLLRDSSFCGVPYGVFDINQLHRSLTLHGDDSEKQLMIKQDGVHAVEQYVLAKYYLTTSVYRHKVRLITDQMISRAIQLGIDNDENADLHSLYTFDNSDSFIHRYLEWDDARFMSKFCIEATGGKCKTVLRRLRERKLLKRVFAVDANELPPEVRDVLPKLLRKKHDRLRREVEGSIGEKISTVVETEIDQDLVILNWFSIRSVREMSKNDEAGILVARQEPEPFDEVSTLFRSINEGFADEFVEVYAPVAWETPTDKVRVRRRLQADIIEVITEKCKSLMEGVQE